MNFASLPAFAVAAVCAGLSVVAGTASAQSVPIPNNSFESPTVTFEQQASPFVDDWTNTGPVLSGGVNLNAGIFPNSPEGQPGHIDNPDGNQIAYIGTQTGNELSQVLTSTYQAGKAYALKVAVAKSLFFPPAPSTANPTGLDNLRLELFYVDGSNVRQPVTLLDIPNDIANGLRDDHLKDFVTTSPILAAADPAVGKSIGVLLTTVGDAGGFFDMDNVTVTAGVPEPATLGGLSLVGGLFALRRRRRIA
ncbi:MAG TPA: PEP-CTERM sorting domain-containing protein [Tepidisphaeraceae bacterium]|jgi:hypothetical protein